ncbi:hypothetical protein [Pseudomonas moraviensis]|jgi:hypothetical protein|uniref:hypothetical protein n=1 Tax=Pseudomonas moraviensis TaxID=321662 RepID=UPI002092FD92|nr:hypothetical protein [Pseudomonas moraviensis]UST60757.1 hypothetical protein NF672_09525 [Pseudomonas moraviensis]UST71145.1 hypothetical protein NF674_09475 [Pseudomonas moraviensis]
MEPVTLGAKFYNSEGLGITVLVKPADNVAGLVIRTCTTNGLIMTGATAPKDPYDYYTKPPVFGAFQTIMQLPYPVHIPAGFGLWSLANNGPVRVSMTYDLLT